MKTKLLQVQSVCGIGWDLRDFMKLPLEFTIEMNRHHPKDWLEQAPVAQGEWQEQLLVRDLFKISFQCDTLNHYVRSSLLDC
jgi:hypothetical protein